MGVEKVFSFGSWDREHPVDRAPGDRIDAQFDAHANAINALEARIARLLRADGKLNHDLLTVESFPRNLVGEISDAALNDALQLRRAAEQALTEIRQIRYDISAKLATARDTGELASREARQLTRLVDGVTSLQEQLTGEVTLALNNSAAIRDAADNTNNDAALAAATAQDWANVSVAWAEYMPDTIPPNILATNAVTGDHWSSRWWANQAASAVGGMLYHYYLGPFPVPPLTTVANKPVQPGALYFNTSNSTMYVWNGATWQPFNTPQPAGTSSLFYQAAANQTVFPLTVPDLFSRSVSLDPAKSQGVEVFRSGVRLTPSGAGYTGDYSVNLATSTVTLALPVALNTIVCVDVLRDPTDLSAGTVLVYKLKSFPFNGVATVFPLLTAAGPAVPPVSDASQLGIVVDGVSLEPGIDYTLQDQVTVVFASAPSADARNFAVFFQSGGIPLANTVASVAAVSSVASLATVQTLLAANNARKGLVIVNTDPNDLYIKYGAGATTAAGGWTYRIGTGVSWEMPWSLTFTGAISGIWSADGPGAAEITEL